MNPEKEGFSSQMSQLHLSDATLSPPTDGSSRSPLVAENFAHHSAKEELIERSRSYVAMIDTLPDDVLVAILKRCVSEEGWKTLVHVCRRWRCIVFTVPRHLDARLVCTAERPVKELLDIWPALPIAVRAVMVEPYSDVIEDNIFVALEQNDRVCEINIDVPSIFEFGKLMQAMTKPYLALTDFNLLWRSGTSLDAPDWLLDGSAPGLRSLHLKGISLPTLPRLLSSATGLVCLRLVDISPSGYIFPETMADCLASMITLQDLEIRFRSNQVYPSRANRQLPPPTRAILPVLTLLFFRGISAYLDELFSRLHAPHLQLINVNFFVPSPIFSIPQISSFIGCTEPFHGLGRAEMLPSLGSVLVTLSPRKRTPGYKTLKLSFNCLGSVWRLRYLNQSNSQFFDDRESADQYLHLHLPIEGEDFVAAQCMEFLRFFSAVEDLYLSEDLARWVTHALQELERERIMEVLPSLQNLFIEGLQPSGPIPESVGAFVAAREISGYPVTVQPWEG